MLTFDVYSRFIKNAYSLFRLKRAKQKPLGHLYIPTIVSGTSGVGLELFRLKTLHNPTTGLGVISTSDHHRRLSTHMSSGAPAEAGLPCEQHR